MSKVKNIWAREIIDSRGFPTVEAVCQLESGAVAVSSVPAGASTGKHEALELRDHDPKRFHGHGVLTAVSNINNLISKEIIGKDPSDQNGIDKLLIKLDGKEDKTRLGANAILAVSEAITKCAAIDNGLPLFLWVSKLAVGLGIPKFNRIPTPLFNMINGGLHGAGNLEFQEFHLIPSSSKSYSEALRTGVEIYMSIGENLKRRGAIHSIGDEGGYAPNLFTNADALEIMAESVNEAGYGLGRDAFLGLDIASTYLYKNGAYNIRDKSAPMNEDAFIEYYKNLNEQYHLTLLEDALYEDAWDGWKKLTSLMAAQTIIVGDDFLVTNPKRVQKAIEQKACSGILIKPNQIGTVSETLEVIKMAKNAFWKVIVSHRSGETNDFFIADFAVGVGADFVKFGGPCRGERVAKYNRLLSIEQELLASSLP